MPYIFTWTIFLFLLKRASSIFRFSIPNIQAGNLVKIVIIHQISQISLTANPLLFFIKLFLSTYSKFGLVVASLVADFGPY